MIGECLCPIKRQIKVAATIVQFANFARRGFVVLEETAIRLIERLSKGLRFTIAGLMSEVVDRNRERQEFAQ